MTEEKGKAHPKAITTPPFSSITVCWHPMQVLVSGGEISSGSAAREVVREWLYGIDWWAEGEMVANMWSVEVKLALCAGRGPAALAAGRRGMRDESAAVYCKFVTRLRS